MIMNASREVASLTPTRELPGKDVLVEPRLIVIMKMMFVKVQDVSPQIIADRENLAPQILPAFQANAEAAPAHAAMTLSVNLSPASLVLVLRL